MIKGELISNNEREMLEKYTNDNDWMTVAIDQELSFYTIRNVIRQERNITHRNKQAIQMLLEICEERKLNERELNL